MARETAVEDTKFIPDIELEKEADKSGMIHTRKSHSENEVLPGYGITNFGVSAYEPDHSLRNNLILSGGLSAAGLLAWKFRDEILSGIDTLINYGLLIKESQFTEE